MLANHKKGIFLLKKAFLVESLRPVAAFPSNFKFKVGDTAIFFLTYVQLTFMLHYRIHGFLLT